MIKYISKHNRRKTLTRTLSLVISFKYALLKCLISRALYFNRNVLKTSAILTNVCNLFITELYPEIVV